MDSQDRDGRGRGSGDRDPVELELAGALAGNESALRRLVELLTPVIQTRVGRRLLMAGPYAPARQTVEDLTQEVFLALFKDDAKVLRDWAPGGGLSLRDYVGYVAARRTISFLRSHRRNPWREQTVEAADLERPSEEAGPERRHSAKEQARLVFDRLRGAASPLGWRLFELLFIEERPIEEVVEATGLTHAAVYQWRSRLRRRVREIAKELDGGGPPSSGGKEP